LPAVSEWSDFDDCHDNQFAFFGQEGYLFIRTLPSTIMPKPLNVDWPAVRVLAVAVGVREAARQMGISQDAVRQRSKREGWMASPKTVAQRALAKPVTSVSPDACHQHMRSPMSLANESTALSSA
jgi:hypothetical protein